MASRRVVITGMGIVSPVGNSLNICLNNLSHGHNGISHNTKFAKEELGVGVAGLVKNFVAEDYKITKKDQRKMDTFIQYAIAAASMAAKDAGLENELGPRAGVAIGSGIGGLPFIEEQAKILQSDGYKKISPFFVPATIANMAAGHVSMRHGLTGPNFAVSTACTTGAHNIGMAARAIKYGDADIMFAGGAEYTSTPLGIAGFTAVKALSSNEDPNTASRPWDKSRDGFVLADGAGVLVLEEYEFAKKRGAKIYAELKGFGMSSDAYHITKPTVEGPKSAMLNSLHDAKLAPEKIDYINAHATSTPTGDLNEINSICQTFLEHSKDLSISSTKSMTGHLLGAAGAVEAIFSILSLDNNIIFPTVNLIETEINSPLDIVANSSKEKKISVVLSNSFGFGGTNASLIFAKL